MRWSCLGGCLARSWRRSATPCRHIPCGIATLLHGGGGNMRWGKGGRRPPRVAHPFCGLGSYVIIGAKECCVRESPCRPPAPMAPGRACPDGSWWTPCWDEQGGWGGLWVLGFCGLRSGARLQGWARVGAGVLRCRPRSRESVRARQACHISKPLGQAEYGLGHSRLDVLDEAQDHGAADGLHQPVHRRRGVDVQRELLRGGVQDSGMVIGTGSEAHPRPLTLQPTEQRKVSQCPTW